MKKYVSRAAATLKILSMIGAIVLVSGVLLAVCSFEPWEVTFLCIAGGSAFVIIMLPCLFAERSRVLRLFDDRIDLARGVTELPQNKLRRNRTVLRFDDVLSVERTFHPGDRIIARDCWRYTFRMKNGERFETLLYAYGVTAELEIYETLCKKCNGEAAQK